MRTNPFNEAWAFLTGTSSFHQEAGPVWATIMLIMFWLLLLASFWIAYRAWQSDPAQRTIERVATWFMRVSFTAEVMWAPKATMRPIRNPQRTHVLGTRG